jgi:hydroxymethylglutaryl-CoA lyase
VPSRITIVEVGPRDGLQNETRPVSTADKIAFVDRLSASGLPVIEVTSFVSRTWVPQMADAEDVWAGITRRPDVRYMALVPNARGLERAVRAGVHDIAIFAAASETFSRRNINASIEDSLAAYRALVADATAAGVRSRAYLSTAFGCPFEGAVPIARVVELTKRLLDLGAFEVAISDTIGIAHPGQVREVLDAVSDLPRHQLALHFHDTRGMAMANVLAALEFDIATFDSSAGGLGGCPYAPGATGNAATEDLLYMLHGLGCETGVDIDAIAAASAPLASVVGHALPSRYLQAAQAVASRPT